VVLDERGRRCPLPVIALARAAAADPSARVLLLADDPAAETDVPAWCGLRGRALAWAGDAPDGRGRAYLVTPAAELHVEPTG
jgi:TusA-related sulfurtransferase